MSLSCFANQLNLHQRRDVSSALSTQAAHWQRESGASDIRDKWQVGRHRVHGQTWMQTRQDCKARDCLFVPLPQRSVREQNQPAKHMLRCILPDLITKSLCCWVLGALSSTMKIHRQMSIHHNGTIVSGRTAGQPRWDRGGWQPACMANKLTRDPCDNEWLQPRVSLRVCSCATGQITYCHLSHQAKAFQVAPAPCCNSVFHHWRQSQRGKVRDNSNLSAFL